MINVEYIAELIEKHGINWSILAKSIGISRQSIDYLKKQRKTSHKTLLHIAEYFKVDAKSLLEANSQPQNTEEMQTTDQKVFYEDIIRTYQERVRMLEEQLAQYQAKKKKDVS